MKNKHVAVIGAGPAGLEASSLLVSMGYAVTLIEKEEESGGHLKRWHQLFPNRKAGSEVLAILQNQLNGSASIEFNKEITSVKPFSGKFIISTSDGWVTHADSVLMTTGFDLFDARKKEEYGYGIYDQVITSADLEEMFKTEDSLKIRLGQQPKRFGFVHCVGSRDEKAGNIYCSKVCCVTAVKQAIEVKELFPDAEVYCFYMDLRMFGRHYEELYKEAQEKYNIQFIRGRLSEASENKYGGVIVKVEDTLLGKPLKITVDMLVLMTGMVAPLVTSRIRDLLGLTKDEDGFLAPSDIHLSANICEIPGLFMAGACSGPKTIGDTLADARSAAVAVDKYFKN